MAAVVDGNDKPGEPGVMFGPLTFPMKPQNKFNRLFQCDWNKSEEIPCVLCTKEFTIPKNAADLFEHLFKEHRLVIADSDNIASLKSYLTYWQVRFSSYPVEEFCSTLTMDVKPDGTPSPGEQYYLLADNLPEDKQLREGLQKERLEYVLEVQEKERTDLNFTRGCLFCRLELQSTRADFLGHLAEQHNLQLGKPENLVFIDQLLDKVQEKLNSLECLYCEKLFKDRNVLKEHMRKKQHKRINPDNATYDRFFIVNYLEMGKNWHHIQNEPDEAEPNTPDWGDWLSDEPEAPIVCLFCAESDQSYEAVLKHMSDAHRFYFRHQCDTLELNFYQQVKVVNFIRRQLHCRSCLNCDETFEDATTLLDHMTTRDHLKVPESVVWDQPEYFFPTYENDSFLCHLEESCEGESPPVEEEDSSTFLPDTSISSTSTCLHDASTLSTSTGHHDCLDSTSQSRRTTEDL